MTAPPATDDRATPVTPWRGDRAALFGVVGAGVLFAALAATVVGLDRAVRWDEVTYLAQVTPGQPDVWFGPQRARGMTIVLAPVALVGAPTGLLRAWLILVHAVALIVAFRPWVPVAGPVAAAAAGVVAVGWVPLYFAVEGYPNLLAAFACVAAAGYVLRWCRGRTPGGDTRTTAGVGGDAAVRPAADDRRSLIAAGLAIAVVAWLRPTESVWIAAALTPVVVLLARRDAWRMIVAFLIGGFVGWLPWLLEAIVRFGGPFGRLDAARATSAAGADRNSLIQYLNLVEGPVRRVVADPVLTGPAALLLAGLAALALLGVVVRSHQRVGVAADRRIAAAVGLWAGLVMVVPYLVLNAGINLRYLLPGLLLGAVAVGGGLVVLVAAIARVPGRAVTVVLLVALVAGLIGVAGWQAQLAATNSDDIAPLQARPVPLGEALAVAADGEPCAFLSNVQWPEIQWHSGCLGEVLDPAEPLLQCPDARRDLAALAADGHRIFVLERGEPPFSPAVADWPVTRLDDPEDGVWRLYERPAELGPDDAPTIPSGDPEVPCLPSRAPDTSQATLDVRWHR